MQLRQLALGLALAAGATALPAQQFANCGGIMDPTAQDVCQKSQDIFAYMAPQLGTAMAGGNATLGQGGSLGGLGRFALGVRGNAVAGSLPQVEDVQVSSTGPRADTYRTEDQYIPFPAVDLAVGIFPGIELGVTRIGGIDAIVNAFYATDYESEDVRLSVSGSKLKLGFGARIGVIEERGMLPGVSVTWLQRDLPTLGLAATAPSELGAGVEDTLGVENFAMKTTALRIVAGKKLGILGVAVGAGQDKYESDAVLRGAHGAEAVDAVPFAFDMTRTTLFADLMLNLKVFRIVGEVGQVSGGDVETFNQFTGTQADDSRLYGSIGLRFGR
jgi:hypothetical protein